MRRNRREASNRFLECVETREESLGIEEPETGEPFIPEHLVERISALHDGVSSGDPVMVEEALEGFMDDFAGKFIVTDDHIDIIKDSPLLPDLYCCANRFEVEMVRGAFITLSYVLRHVDLLRIFAENGGIELTTSKIKPKADLAILSACIKILTNALKVPQFVALFRKVVDWRKPYFKLIQSDDVQDLLQFAKFLPSVAESLPELHGMITKAGLIMLQRSLKESKGESYDWLLIQYNILRAFCSVSGRNPDVFINNEGLVHVMNWIGSFCPTNQKLVMKTIMRSFGKSAMENENLRSRALARCLDKLKIKGILNLLRNEDSGITKDALETLEVVLGYARNKISQTNDLGLPGILFHLVESETQGDYDVKERAVCLIYTIIVRSGNNDEDRFPYCTEEFVALFEDMIVGTVPRVREVSREVICAMRRLTSEDHPMYERLTEILESADEES